MVYPHFCHSIFKTKFTLYMVSLWFLFGFLYFLFTFFTAFCTFSSRCCFGFENSLTISTNNISNKYFHILKLSGEPLVYQDNLLEKKLDRKVKFSVLVSHSLLTFLLSFTYWSFSLLLLPLPRTACFPRSFARTSSSVPPAL